eukprot:UN25632
MPTSRGPAPRQGPGANSSALKVHQKHPIKLVQLEGMAMLKIIRHCDQAVDKHSTGSLLGLVRKHTLEITDCYRNPDGNAGRKCIRSVFLGADGKKIPEGEEEERYGNLFLQSVRKLGVDWYTIGWYGCAFYNEFFTRELVNHHFQYQDRIPFSVLLVYDPVSTRRGRLALRAVRLKDSMMDELRDPGSATNAIRNSKLSTHDVFEEIPIVLKNHSLTQGFLFEMKQSSKISAESLAMNNENDLTDLMNRV